MKASVYTLILAMWVFGSQSWGQGTLITAHSGAVDPVSEGFAVTLSGSPNLIPITDDSGFAAWSIRSNSGEDIAIYSRTLTEEQAQEVSSPWVMSVTLRLVQQTGDAAFSIFATFQTDDEFFKISIGAQPGGDPIVQVGNSEYALNGLGSGYHDYQLMYDDVVGLASLWVDGAPIAANIAGTAYPSSSYRLSWGVGQHPPGSAYANWNEVSLWAVPEPSALTLLLLGSGAAACLRMRRVKPRRNREQVAR